MKVSREGASTTLRGSEFQEGMVLGKKEYLKVLVDVWDCRNLREWDDLVLEEPGDKYGAEGMSTRPWTIL